MSADKKKMIVLVALVVVILCVGAFQMLGGGGGETPPPTPAKKADPAKDAPKVVEEIKNPNVAPPLPARDPFQNPLMGPEQAVQQPVQQPTPPPEKPVKKHYVRDTEPSLPRVEISGKGFSEGGQIAPMKITAIPEPTLSFTLSGVMLGRQNLAVFNDASGEQRIVPAGGSLDADTKVISVDKYAVTVRFHGKTKRLTVEGNPNDK